MDRFSIDKHSSLAIIAVYRPCYLSVAMLYTTQTLL
jgi:hypothetical protein